MDGVTVSVDVTNTGTIAGKEVVQVYVHDRASGLVRPPKELKGFAKVELQPGETRTVSIPLDFRSFAYYHPGYRQWIVEDGEFDILIGASAADIRCTVTVSLQSAPALPCVLTRESTIRAWLSDPRGRAVAGPTIRRLMVHLGKPFDASEAIDEADRLELMGLLEMPLRSLLQYDESVLPMTADELVDDLLRQVHGAPG